MKTKYRAQYWLRIIRSIKIIALFSANRFYQR